MDHNTPFTIDHTGNPYRELFSESVPLSRVARLLTAAYPVNGHPHCFTREETDAGTALYNALWKGGEGFVAGTLLYYGLAVLPTGYLLATAYSGLRDPEGLTLNDGVWHVQPDAFEKQERVDLPSSGYVIPPDGLSEPAGLWSHSGFPLSTTPHREFAEEALEKLFPHHCFAERELSYWIRGRPGKVAAVVVHTGKRPWYLLGDRSLAHRNGWVGSLRLPENGKQR